MEKFYQEQVERVDRLMKIVEALSFYDIIVFTANQCGI